MKKEEWFYLIKTKRFRVAWISPKGWEDGNGILKCWFFSVRRKRYQYSKKLQALGDIVQISILGLNIGIIIKLKII